MSGKNTIAAFIGLVSIVGFVIALTNNAFGTPPGTFELFGAVFSAAQIFWLAVLWGIAALVLWLLVQEAAAPEVDLTPVTRVETQIRGFEGRFQDIDNRVHARLGEVDNRLKTLEAMPRSFAAAGKIPVKDDELEIIEGIGPKMATALKAAGIDTFTKLAAATETELQSAIERAGMSFAPSIPTWARQAQYLVDGDWEGFQEYVKRLTAGRQG
jgi:predicted flap endonuclease-1-like 5' DNA nuclease